MKWFEFALLTSFLRRFFLPFVFLGLMAGCKTPKLPQEAFPIPTPPREFRAAWVATVANIDWPSQAGLPVETQKAELIAIMDRAVELNLNALIFQVRPHADALYDSPLEPWSEYLTGKQGQAPEPYYDPLVFAIEEAHKRGLELHAWFNPYRAWHPAAKSTPALDHVTQIHPEWTRTYGTYKWLDPGHPDAALYSMNVMMDVVKRYDVDGIHIDDYFYPYPISQNGKEVDFPDDSTYTASKTLLSKPDWRRENVNRFVERLYKSIKAEKPWVKFGISPFGIWRPGYPPQIKGFDQYDKLYADARLWLREGWMDYMSPQLYWQIQKAEQSYPVLLNWWIGENIKDRHIWPGNFTSKILETDATKRYEPQEILDQVALTQRTSGATGNIHFSMKALMALNNPLGGMLKSAPYQKRALVPASPWLQQGAFGKPIIKFLKNKKNPQAVFSFEPDPNGASLPNPHLWVVRSLYGRTWLVDIWYGDQGVYSFVPYNNQTKPDWVVISPVDRAGVEGEPVAQKWK